MTLNPNSSTSVNQLGVFAKYWEPGTVKTRLAKQIGHEKACQIYELFVRHLLEKFSNCQARRVLSITPDNSAEFFQQSFGNWSVQCQTEGDLGDRMCAYFRKAFESANQVVRRAVLIGTDSPHIPQDIIAKAWHQLEFNDLVLGPTFDGGYYLVGMSRFLPGIFHGINWSTESVMDQTLAIAKQFGYSVELLPRCADIDFLDDLQTVMNTHRNESELKLFRTVQEILNR